MSAYYAYIDKILACIRKMKEGGKNTNDISKSNCI